jgi:hypothetical protein
MRKEQVYPCGYKVYDDDNNLIGYGGEHNGSGYIYKNEEVFVENPDEICYISEGGFGYAWECKEYISVEEAKRFGDTRNTILKAIADDYKEEYMLTDEQLDCCTKCVFADLEWSCVLNYITESYWIDDLIEFCHDNILEPVFTKLQYDAIMNDKSPKEYENLTAMENGENLSSGKQG